MLAGTALATAGTRAAMLAAPGDALAGIASRAADVAASLRHPASPVVQGEALQDAAGLVRELHVGSGALDRPPLRTAITVDLLAGVDAVLARVGTAPLARRVPERGVAEASRLRGELSRITSDADGRLATQQWDRSFSGIADGIEGVGQYLQAAEAPVSRATHPIGTAVARAQAGVAALGPATPVALRDVPAAVALLDPLLADLDRATPVHDAGRVVAIHYADEVADVQRRVRPHVDAIARTLRNGSDDPLTDLVARQVGIATRGSLRVAARELDLLATGPGAAVRAAYVRTPATIPSAAALHAIADDVDAVGSMLGELSASQLQPARVTSLAAGAVAARLDAEVAMLADAAGATAPPTVRDGWSAARRSIHAVATELPTTGIDARGAALRATARDLRDVASRTSLVTARAQAQPAATSLARARDRFHVAAATAADFTRVSETVPAWRAATDQLEAAYVAMRPDLPRSLDDAVGGRIAAFDRQLTAAESALVRSAAHGVVDRPLAESTYPHLALAARLRQDSDALAQLAELRGTDQI